MKLFPESTDDLLDVDSLPSTNQTELNYRTRPLSADQELRLTQLVLFGSTAALFLVSSLTSSFTGAWPALDALLILMIVLLAAWLVFRRVTGGPFEYALFASFVLSAACIGGTLLDWTIAAGVWSCHVSLLLAWLTAALIARQVAAWMLVDPRVDRETMRRWEVNLPRIVPHGLSLDCPELLTWSVSVFAIGPAWSAAAWLAREIDAFWLWPMCLVGTFHALWVAWHIVAFPILPFPNPIRCWRLTVQALIVFATYDIYFTPAAGVFHFPTRWLRHPGVRIAWLVMVLFLLALCCGACCPSPWQADSFLIQVVTNLVFVTTAAPAILATLLWFSAGSLLARFDTQLAVDQPGDETDQPTIWDNYVDRIINSDDELESEHFFIGTSRSGDYPILLHRDILDQHGHIVGDTGASKTSLGIAPLVTQLIARGDATVVIVDLKGDRALFETCRREAARTRKLPFRWLSNEVGTTTFAFNPFRQTHNQFLSHEQFVQELLQGLALDYGLAYGAGYFTAMNEIVLSSVLQNCRAQSFRELDRRLRNQKWYESIGHKQDWNQARHLAALVTRLAGSDLLNVVPGMFPGQPEVHDHALDVVDLFERPQVVYLSLRSALESSNAPTVARLFLWALFTAASHRRSGHHRVYCFLDEFQQVISDGVKLIFEQFRDLGGTIIAAHQTAGQLHRQGTDLGDTVDSCTAMKQVFRASDLQSLQDLEKLSGKRTEHVPMWMQKYERGTGDLIERYDEIHASEGLVKVREEERPRLDCRELQQISSGRQSSLVRFTFGSGYTQFAGASVPMLTPYPISFEEYQKRKQRDWPTAPGAFIVPSAQPESPHSSDGPTEPATPVPTKSSVDEFDPDFQQRARLSEQHHPVSRSAGS